MYEERRTVVYYNPTKMDTPKVYSNYEMNADPTGHMWNKNTGEELNGYIRKKKIASKYFLIKGDMLSVKILLSSTFPDIYRPKESNGEIWKPLRYSSNVWTDDKATYFAKCYEVSNYGNIRSICTGAKLKPAIDKDGYFRYSFNYFNTTVSVRANVAVAYTFLENPDNLPVVNHKDGNVKNNYVDNLEFCTNQDNTRHAVKTGLQKTPYYGYRIKCVETGKVFDFMAEAIDYYKIDKRTLGQCLRHQCRIDKKGYHCYCRGAGKHPETGERLHWLLVNRETGREYTPEEFARMRELEISLAKEDFEIG